MTFFRASLFAVIALAAAPAAATAQDAAPPGNSAVDQYREATPPPVPNSERVPESIRRRLAARGADGVALAAALDRSGGVASASGATSLAGTEAGSSNNDDASSSTDDAGTSGEVPGTGGPSGPGPESAAQSREDQGSSPTEAAASATLGPFPIWAVAVAAVLFAGLGLAVRYRASA